ncbi:unnamed protein product, partial [Tuber aestivum]
LEEYIAVELDVSRLNRIHDHLWFAGSQRKPRPLHEQIMKQRTLLITEQADLHLVWWGKVLLIKPLPPFLLSYTFFQSHLCTENVPNGQLATLHASASGLLYSYANLILHESDFRIARELGLLPEMTWQEWARFARSVRLSLDKSNLENTVNQRYLYGELRRKRLNWICRFVHGHWIRGYHYVYTEYHEFFSSNFAWLVLVFAYLTVVFSAMQVALTTHAGTVTPLLQSISFRFSVASLVAVAAVVASLCVLFGVLVVNNLYWGL